MAFEKSLRSMERVFSAQRINRKVKYSLTVFLLGAMAAIGGAVLPAQSANAAVVPCAGANIAFGRQEFCGFFDNSGQNAGDDLMVGGVPGTVDTVEEFITMIETDLTSGSPASVTAARFLVLNMIGAPAGSPRTVSAGQLADWKGRVRSYANLNETATTSTGQNGSIEWKSMEHLDCGTINTMYQVAENDIAPYLNAAGNSDCEVPSVEEEYIVIRDANGDAVYEIRRLCMNPERTLNVLAEPEMSIGNFVWFDANNDGIVNSQDADAGFNGIGMELYGAAADTNNDGLLSSAEVIAATPTATTTTANDGRIGSPTNGDAGYYRFTGLAQGDYFICVANTNFTSGGILERYTNSPTPSGVGDTQDDRYDHGDVPVGGTVQTVGTCSSEIALSAFVEPVTSDGNPDDDDDNASDFTIDFGFWHSYSLGNRVWLDSNNSGAIDAPDGTNPGVAGVTVVLYNCSNTQVATTTTIAGGYYRFDNLAAGCYQVEVADSNFTTGQALGSCNVSSSGALQSATPNNDTDIDDNGIDPAQPLAAVRSGQITLGAFATEPTTETDLSGTGQGADNDFANMTVDFGFRCNVVSDPGTPDSGGLANTGMDPRQSILLAGGLIAAAGVSFYLRKKASL